MNDLNTVWDSDASMRDLMGSIVTALLSDNAAFGEALDRIAPKRFTGAKKPRLTKRIARSYTYGANKIPEPVRAYSYILHGVSDKATLKISIHRDYDYRTGTSNDNVSLAIQLTDKLASNYYTLKNIWIHTGLSGQHAYNHPVKPFNDFILKEMLSIALKNFETRWVKRRAEASDMVLVLQRLV